MSSGEGQLRELIVQLREELAEEKRNGAMVEAIVDRVLHEQPGAMNELRAWAAGTR